MAHFADPTRCPGCAARITTTATDCGRCGLPLRGETVAQLYATLVRADELLDSLRLSGPPPAPAPAVPAAVPVASRRRAGLTAASVPQILLGLGAACLLVAALVFLAVTWSVLGVGGRTVTLVAFTVLSGCLAAGLARRGLRAAAESLTLVALGLLTLDLVGAEHAGWWGELSTPSLLQLVGGVLLTTACAAALGARRTPVGVLTGAEAVAVVGTTLLALGVADADGPTAALQVLATALSALVTMAAHRLGLRVVSHGAGLVAVTSWLALTAHGLDRALGYGHGWRELWLEQQGWPLLAAAALAASPALVSWLTRRVRTGSLAVAHLLLVVALLAPTWRLHPTSVTLVVLAVLAGTGLAAALLPRRWALVQCLTQGVAAAVVLAHAAPLATRSAARLLDAAVPVWSGRPTDRFPVSAWTGVEHLPAAWLLPLCVLTSLGTGLAVSRALRGTRASTAAADARPPLLAVAVLAASAIAALVLYPVPIWLVLAALVAVAVGFWLLDAIGRSTASTGTAGPTAITACFLGAALLGSLHAELLTALVLCVVLAASVWVHLRASVVEVSGVAGLVVAGTLAGSVWAWGAIADAEPTWVALAGLAVLGATVLLAPYLLVRSPSDAHHHGGIEVGAATSALALAVAGALLAPSGDQSVWVAVYLTVAGAVVTAVALLRSDRRLLGCVGGALLAAATWVRLQDLGVSVPEPYTLPTAVALVLVGLHRLHADASASSVSALAPGLSLALVPTLLWTLDEPGGLRALLLGLCCLLLVLAGARTGWTAPLTVGAGVGAVLLMRLAAPYVGDAVPRWVLIGAAGVLLLAVGTTWERRVGEVRAVLGYARTLR